jgi:hypothetical protein
MYIGRMSRWTINQQCCVNDGAPSAGIEVEIQKIVETGTGPASRNRNSHQEDECHQQGMVEIQPDGAREEGASHCIVTVTLSDAGIDTSGKKSGKEYESFCCRNEPERLVGVGTEDCWQVGARNPHQHKTADGIEFVQSAHDFEDSRSSLCSEIANRGQKTARVL